MAKKPTAAGKRSALLDTRVVFCGDCLEQLKQQSQGQSEGSCPECHSVRW